MASSSSPFNSEHPAELGHALSIELPAADRRQRHLQGASVVGSRKEIDDARLCYFDGHLTRRLARNAESARNAGERGRTAGALDRAQQSPTRAEIQRGVAVETSGFFERVRRSQGTP